MNIYRRPPLLLVVITMLLFAFTINSQKLSGDDLKPTVILISLDGFRWDYLDKFKPPAISRLAKNGVRAKWMIPSFPTKTFPNHYTVVTGLYPQNHGIVENNVYDFGTTFSMSKRAEVQNPRWWGGEPIWVTAEKQGQRSASYFWPGSETPIHGVLPSISRQYNGDVPNTFRVDRLLSYLDKPEAERPTLLTLYFSHTDDVGHAFGPDAEETRYAVQDVDDLLERLIVGLKKRGIDDKVNIIITADHGMTNVPPKNAVILDDKFNVDDAEQVIWSSPVVQIFPKAGKLDAIYDRIKDLDKVKCWKKADIPARFNYRTGHRIAPILCLGDNNWMVTDRRWYDNWYKNLAEPEKPRGAHGYDNALQEMQATFIANGPAFKKGFVAEPFENIEVYNLMCKILGLKPAKNDGDLRRVDKMLK
jgi:predicted AlkP superfamily pyrophosphatase or phosphodiesterase